MRKVVHAREEERRERAKVRMENFIARGEWIVCEWKYVGGMFFGWRTGGIPVCWRTDQPKTSPRVLFLAILKSSRNISIFHNTGKWTLARKCHSSRHLGIFSCSRSGGDSGGEYLDWGAETTFELGDIPKGSVSN